MEVDFEKGAINFMADLVNPYANPYLPSFVNQRPVISSQPQNVQMPQMNYSGMSFGQINSVRGFDGAKNWANGHLANGSSAILAEEDPNLSRVYIIAKDANGQIFIQGGDFVPIEEPKPVTMDDINSKMNRILERLDKLEERKDDQSVRNASWKSPKQSGNATNQSDGRNGTGVSESTGSGSTNGTK